MQCQMPMTSFRLVTAVYPCSSFANISTTASFGETSPCMEPKYCIASPVPYQDWLKMACAIGAIRFRFTLTLVFVASTASATGELDGMLENSSWIVSVPLLFHFLLSFRIGVHSLLLFLWTDIDCTGTEHFAMGFCLVFLRVGTLLTMILYHLVFPPGF
jgi:hypothetical protein